MKKISTVLIVFAIAALSFSSCTTTKKSFQSFPVLSKNVQLDPIKADIVVNESQKLKGESKATYFLIFRTSGESTYADGITYSNRRRYGSRIAQVRAAAAYNALSAGDYDILVHPKYSVTEKRSFLVRKYNAVVEGYGANYKNFRTEKQKVIITDNSKEYFFPDGE